MQTVVRGRESVRSRLLTLAQDADLGWLELSYLIAYSASPEGLAKIKVRLIILGFILSSRIKWR